ncbi:MAG: Hpt domain-containing protein [Methylovulum sp.]|nr:Hpt domain-containing protein [Methylovulum sp.]
MPSQPIPLAEAASIIDRNVLAQLQADMSEEVYPQLLALFLAQGAERVETIEEVLAKDDVAALANELHAFKSEAATFGAIPLAALVSHIHLLCHQGKKEQAFAEAAAIRAAWLLVSAALQQ